jgi:hypothetical protein
MFAVDNIDETLKRLRNRGAARARHILQPKSLPNNPICSNPNSVDCLAVSPNENSLAL